MLNKCFQPMDRRNTKDRSDTAILSKVAISASPWRMDGVLTGRKWWKGRERIVMNECGGARGVESFPRSLCADVGKLDKWKGRLKLYNFSHFLSSHLSEGWFCSCWQVANLLSPLKLTEKPDKYPLLAALPWQMVWHSWYNPKQQW